VHGGGGGDGKGRAVETLTQAQAGWVHGGAHPRHGGRSLGRLLLLLAVVGEPGALGGAVLFCKDHVGTL